LRNLSVSNVSSTIYEDWDQFWGLNIVPPALSAFLSSQLGYLTGLGPSKGDGSKPIASEFTVLRNNYLSLLPEPLKCFLSHLDLQLKNTETLIHHLPINISTEHLLSVSKQIILDSTSLTDHPNLNSKIDILKKSIVFQYDSNRLRKLYKFSDNHLSLGSKGFPEVFESIPILNKEKEDLFGKSHDSANEDGNYLGESIQAQSLGDDIGHFSKGYQAKKYIESMRASDVGFQQSEASHLSLNQFVIENLLIRRDRQIELSCLEEFDSSSLQDLVQSYDSISSQCFKSNVSADFDRARKPSMSSVSSDQQKNEVDEDSHRNILGYPTPGRHKSHYHHSSDAPKFGGNASSVLKFQNESFPTSEFSSKKDRSSVTTNASSLTTNEVNINRNASNAASRLVAASMNKTKISKQLLARGPTKPSSTESKSLYIVYGKVPILPSEQKKYDDADDLIEYEKKYGINPFRQKDGERYLNSMTHNRRRWSHVFPFNRSNKVVDYGLNWKSLTQPAILPLNTDYFPSQKDLDNNYTCDDYTFTWDTKDCLFATIHSAVLELVCQRLSHVRFKLKLNFS
jgi:hypothetical protein